MQDSKNMPEKDVLIEAIKTISKLCNLKVPPFKEDVIADKLRALDKTSPNPFRILQHSNFKTQREYLRNLALGNGHTFLSRVLSVDGMEAPSLTLSAAQRESIEALLKSTIPDATPARFSPVKPDNFSPNFVPRNANEQRIVKQVRANWKNIKTLEAALKVISIDELMRIRIDDSLNQNIFHEAVFEDNPKVVDFLVKKLSKQQLTKAILTPNSSNYNVIFFTAESGNAKFLKLFLENISKEELSLLKDSEGDTPLHFAADHNRVNCVDLLAEGRSAEEALTKSTDCCGFTPLHSAAKSGSISSLKSLLKYFPEQANRRGSHGQTALQEAVSGNKMEAAAELLKFLSAEEANACNDAGTSALQQAIVLGHNGIVELLLEKLTSAEANQAERIQGFTALHFAAQENNTAALALLLNKEGLDINSVTTCAYAYTPLHLSAFIGSEESVALFLAKPQIDVNVQGKNGNTPLHCATGNGYKNIVERLLIKDARLAHKRNNKGLTALDMAVKQGHVEVVKVLLEYLDEAQINDVNEQGATAFHLTILSRNHEVIAAFLACKKTNCNAVFKNNTVLHYAVAAGDMSILRLLVASNRMDFSIENTEGLTALDCALRREGHSKNNQKIIDLLRRDHVEQQLPSLSLVSADLSIETPEPEEKKSAPTVVVDKPDIAGLSTYQAVTDVLAVPAISMPTPAPEVRAEKIIFSFLADWNALNTQPKSEDKGQKVRRNMKIEHDSPFYGLDLWHSNKQRYVNYAPAGILADEKNRPAAAQPGLSSQSLKILEQQGYQRVTSSTITPVYARITDKAKRDAKKEGALGDMEKLLSDGAHLLPGGDRRQGITPLVGSKSGARKLNPRGKGGRGDARLIASEGLQLQAIPETAEAVLTLTFNEFTDHAGVHRSAAK